MSFLKRYPVFCVLILVLVLLFVLGIWLWRNEEGKIHQAEDTLQQERNRIEQMGRGVLLDPDSGELIPPTQENVDVLKARKEEVLADLVTIRDNLQSSAENVLGESADEFTFLPSLQSYISRFTNRAQAANIQLSENEAFGFNRYFREARNPPASAIPKLDKQRQILEYILRILFESAPTSIVSVEREPLEAINQTPEQRGQLVSNNADLFQIDRLITIGGSEHIDTLAFRITFTGRTDSLRRFLNRLAEFELPLMVRSIDVRPVAEERRTSRRARSEVDSLFDLFGGGGAAQQEPERSGREPVITENQSRFVVVLEYIEIDLDPASIAEGRGA